MNVSKVVSKVLAIILLVGGVRAASADAGSFDDELVALTEEWAAAAYQTRDEDSRAAAFESLLAHAAKFSSANPLRVEAVAWEGIILSDYAGRVSAMGAMKYAKAARDTLHRAEKIDPAALNGGVYASLGALYSKVPGGLIGFGDDKLAAEYFRKALAVDPNGIDNNYFYGDFLLDKGEHAKAAAVLEHALAAPPVADRPIFDAGRRGDIRALLAIAQRKAS
jgi:tetratricopeptide (TPR) repeat protein